jgi:hypothetical protein
MDVRTFEAIKNKIETLKTKKAKAEGAIESIEAGWKSAYGFSTLADAKNLDAKLQDEITTVQDQLEELYTELNGLTDWTLV